MINGRKFDASIVKKEQQFRHSNGLVTDLYRVELQPVSNNGTIGKIVYGGPKNITFEVPAGTVVNSELINRIGIQGKENGNDIEYLGIISSDGNILGHSQKVEDYVKTTISPQILQEKAEQNRRIEESRRISAENYEKSVNSFKEKMAEDHRKYCEEVERKKQARLSNPFLIGKENSGYDGVDLNTGNILRIRNLNKIGKDELGTYLYTAYINSVSSQNEVEILSGEVGSFVCFTLNNRIEDIVNGKNPQEITNLLRLFSNSQQKTVGENDKDSIYIGDNRNPANSFRNLNNTLRNAIADIQSRHNEEMRRKAEQQGRYQ